MLLLVGGLVWLSMQNDRPVDPPKQAAPASVVATLDAVQPIQPLPPLPKLSPERVALGERLFSDKRFSADNTLACVSCHDFADRSPDAH